MILKSSFLILILSALVSSSSSYAQEKAEESDVPVLPSRQTAPMYTDLTSFTSRSTATTGDAAADNSTRCDFATSVGLNSNTVASEENIKQNEKSSGQVR